MVLLYPLALATVSRPMEKWEMFVGACSYSKSNHVGALGNGESAKFNKFTRAELWLGRNRIKTANLCGLKCIKKLAKQSLNLYERI
ncbi:hypothetical protein P3X46_007710 [Hevea brasiliensis]|uniref:Uncharacterized protein n=1 Tax=Hevea brasiliensis TaxID=3981 RepID=A0ABQ9MUX1_HEVBR|nr:hypothetical protein P3X46_007710 [Hevea brasiliensis]